MEAGFSTAQEETAQMTGGDYSRNIRQRVIEATRKKEVDKISNPQEAPQNVGGTFGGNGAKEDENNA